MNITKKILGLIFILLLSKTTFSQVLFVRTLGTEIKVSHKKDNAYTDLDPENLKTDVRVGKGLIIDATELAAGTNIKINTVNNSGNEVDITRKIDEITINKNRYTYLAKDKTIKILKLEITPSGGKDTIFTDIGKDYKPKPPGSKSDTVGKTDTTTKYTRWQDFLEKNIGPAMALIKGSKRYFPKQNKAYICVDPYGNIIGRKPVNLDQDDEVIFLMIVPDNADYDLYSVDDNDAEYAPSDLAFRPSDNPTENSIHSGKKESKIAYTLKELPMGPYTSANVTFNVNKGNTTLNTFTIHINPLYHLALGASYVISDLESPDYSVLPIGSNPGANTIDGQNGGNRTFITFNVIWYWATTFKYLNGDPLTRGRDVLKEPNFLTRINPTFGIALKGSLNENFFTGLTFEFARGGAIVAGWHYGKVKRLADRNFIPGQTVFTGAQADVRTQQLWKWGKFIGITLDTRIFNRLFNRSSDGS